MKRLIATAALATLVSSPAFAQSYQPGPHTGLYLGAGLGQSKLDNDTLDLLSDLGASTDDTDTAYKLFVGYDFNPNFSLEASYVDFGDFTASGSINGEPADGKASADGFGFALLGRLPIQHGFGIYGKVGLIAWDGKGSGNFTTTQGNRVQVLGSADGTDPFYGVGVEYVVNQVMVRAEYEYFDLRDQGEDFTIDLISAGIGYLF
ncbi:outer membrane beta-barrel protein [Halomonas sp. M5N1S17]|uniref:outer membrane beta-barrel protein n=1 Tax=Halomonas alkalisoli TaxID=2907158 RepID=UPI001F1D39C0|nr:outer membrane beta-barrel protein [Halomonas alkalisoli]MCE9664569.1 outer membrane beta-barrel protein [Halomonas alkalisoli]